MTANSGDCSAGYYCLASSTTATPSGTSGVNGVCPAHHWCAIGVGMGVPSLPGYWDASTGRSTQSSTLQTQGYWSHTVSATSTYFSTPTMGYGGCQIGYFCPAGSTWAFSAANYCDVTEYCPSNSYQTATCAAGTYQPNPLQEKCFNCPAGFYCTAAVTNDITDYRCPKGHYCPEGTTYSTQYPCPAGTYNDHYGATSSDECVEAAPGYYMSSTAAELISTATLCTAGYYCERGSTTGTPTTSGMGGKCTAGYYCPAGTPKMIACTAGSMCTIAGLSAPNFDCYPGYYCVQGTGNSYGTWCQVGYYCPTGSPRPTPCPAGTYQIYIGRSKAT